MAFCTVLSSLFLLLTLSGTLEGAVLSLESYLSQVGEKNTGAKSTELMAEAEKQRAPEGALPQAWTFIANAENRTDLRRRLTLFQIQNQTQLYTLGISKLTNFGLNMKLTANVQPFSYLNVPASFATVLPFSTYYDVYATAELTQSIWQNGFGRSTRASQEVAEATALANHHRNAYSVLQIHSQAETAYWNASGAQEILRIQKANLERARKLVEWSRSRTQLDLADKADLLQAESAARLRELEYLQAQSDMKTNARQLNSLRGVDSDNLEEQLVPVYVPDVEAIASLPRAQSRHDVLAAVQDARVAQSNAQLGREKNKPVFEAYAQYTVSGRDTDFSTALRLVSMQYTYTVLGVRFSAPLEFGLLSRDLSAYLKEQRAAELNLARKRFEQDNDWNELTRRLGEAKNKLKLARELEKAQNDKYSYERERLKRGRTTLFQVLQFAQDYAGAQLTRIQRETEVRSILTQMKTFGTET